MSRSPWLARLKQERTPEMAPTEPTKPLGDEDKSGFVGFAGAESVAIPESWGADAAADEDGSTEFSGQYARARERNSERNSEPEADAFAARVRHFTDRGMTLEAADALAERLAIRDADFDDRRLCLECSYLGAQGRCIAAATGRLRGVAAQLEPLQTILQRCDAFGLRKGLV